MESQIDNILHGEAEEFDEESQNYEESIEGKMVKSSAALSKGVIVAGEAPESDEEEDIEEDQEECAPKAEETSHGITPLQVDAMKRGDSIDLSDSESPVPSKQNHTPKYDTLLHRKLREKNATFRRNLCDTVGQIYVCGAKEIKHITNHLMKSQTSVQEVSQAMRLLTNDLFYLEDKMDIVASCSLLPDIKKDLSSRPESIITSTVSPQS